MHRRIRHILTGAIVCLSLSLFCHAQEAPYHFIQLSDPQFGMYAENKGFEQETANYEFAVATANRLKPGFVIVTGDLVNQAGDPSQIAEYLRISGKLDPSIGIFHVPGNHDVALEPTTESLALYREKIGRDYYSFRAGPIFGIVLNSALIYAPQNVPDEFQKQESWLKKELEAAKNSGAKHIIIFQHHPYFLKDVSEPDAYANIPKERRQRYLELLKSYGIEHVFAGHYHRNVIAKDGELEMIVSGPVGRPEGDARSGVRVVKVTGSNLEHRYYDFGALPNSLMKK